MLDIFIGVHLFCDCKCYSTYVCFVCVFSFCVMLFIDVICTFVISGAWSGKHREV
jgi:hypothetical protein